MANTIFNKSIFAKYFTSTDPEALAWAENVLDKILDKDLAKYIIVEDENGNATDADELFRPIATFNSYLVRFAREFRDFKENQYLSDQYLTNDGHFTCGEESLVHLLYIISNLLRIRAQRGTTKSIEVSETAGVADGELLRLVCWDAFTFFKLGVAKSKHNSWNANNSSPLYRGCTGRYDLNVGYEYTESVLDLSKYPLINSNYVELAQYRGKSVMELTPAVSVNLISNGTFTTNLSGWSNVGAGTDWAWDAWVPAIGVAAVNLGSLGGSTKYLTQSIAINGGDSYNIDIDYEINNSEPAANAILSVYLSDGTNRQQVIISDSEAAIVSFLYSKSITVVADADYDRIEIQLVSGASSGDVVFAVDRIAFAKPSISGIGANDEGKRIVVDPRLNFEITFSVAQDITYENITFGCLAFDIDGNLVDLKNAATGAGRNYFFETRRLNKAGQFYFVRGIIYNKDKELISVSENKLNIGFGQNLKFTEDVVSIIPVIVLDNEMSDDSDSESDNFSADSIDSDSGAFGDESDSESWYDNPYDGIESVFLWNIKVTPCSLPYERCYLNNKNFIDVIMDNKNGKYTNDQIDDILRKYFIPYNTSFAVTHIE